MVPIIDEIVTIDKEMNELDRKLANLPHTNLHTIQQVADLRNRQASLIKQRSYLISKMQMNSHQAAHTFKHR